MIIRRREDWPERLTEALHAARLKTFAWGEFDCCTFVADAVADMTDTDIAEDLRGYTDGPGALRALRRFAGGGVPEAMEKISRQFGMYPVDMKHMQRGDIAMVNPADFAADEAFGGMLTLCIGPLIALATERGLIYTDKRAVRVAWHIL